MVVPAQWERTGDFSEDLAAVKQTEKWGIIDKSGKMVIAPQFDEGQSNALTNPNA